MIIHVVLYNINLYQLHNNIEKIMIIVLIHLIRFKKGYIQRLLGKILSILVI